MKQKRADNKFSFLLPVGIGIGTAIGALIHNIGVGLAIGAAIGTIANLIAYYMNTARGDENKALRE